jgi:PAS domain S-box-containing protein
MNEQERTNPELAEENALLKRRIHELEQSALEHRQTETTGRKQVEKEIRESEAKYRTLIENIRDGIYILDFSGAFTFVNDVIVERSGFPAEWFLSRSYLDVISKEDRERVQRHFNAVMDGKTQLYSLSYPSKTGNLLHVEVCTAPLFDNAKVIGLLGISRNITERKQMEKELRESEERFRNLIEKMPVGIIIYEGTKIRYVNPAVERTTGYTREELYLTDIWDMAHPEFKDSVREYVHRKQRKESIPELHEIKIITKSGEELWLERNAIAIELEGKPVVLVTITDITERRHAEEALRKSEKIYRVILESCSDAILLGDGDGNLIEANRMAERLLGYSREELLQMHYTKLHPVTEQERTVAAYRDIATKGQGSLHDGAILRKDGTVVPVDITAMVIEYEHRKVLQASFRDISMHKNTKEVLERLVRERTVELSEKNKQLAEEVKEHKRTEVALRNKTKQMQLNSHKLQELNTALKVLLKQREEDKRDLEEKVLANVKELLIPYLEELKKGRMDARSEMQVSILEANLHNIISPFTHRLSSKYTGFTPREIQVANLIRQGRSTKDIAHYVGVSQSAINLYRHSIRNKLGLVSRKINLRSHLMALS